MKSSRSRHSDEGRIQVSENSEHGFFVPQDDGVTGALRDPLLDILTEIRTGNISVDKYNTDRLNAIREDIFVFEMQGK